MRTPEAAVPLEPQRWLLSACAMVVVSAGAFAVAAFAAYGMAVIGSALRSVGGLALAGGTVLCVLACGVRVLRWRWLLRLQGLRLPVRFDLRVYLAGLGLSTTPGKVAETWRCALLLRKGGPVSKSFAAFFSDHFSDVIGVALLDVLGGVGRIDASLGLQLHARGGAVPKNLAATLATRASTLLLAWLLGFAALTTFARSTERP